MRYHLSDVLSILTGRMISTRNMNGIHDILNYMTGETVYTHQMPKVIQECIPEILKQHPALGEIDFANVPDDEEDTKIWLAQQIEKYGEELFLGPLPISD